jgi:hypothetical protein
MTILAQALFTFVRCDLMSFSLLSTRHSQNPFKNEKIKYLMIITVSVAGTAQQMH